MQTDFYEKIVGGNFPYIIAEIGSNHNGDMVLARKLMDSAKEAGADCVKFQSWSKDTIFSKVKYDENHFIGDDYRNRDDFTLEEIVDKFSISENQLIEMFDYAKKIGIDCTSTPFSRNEADFLTDKQDVPFIKVASMDVNNYPFLEYIAKKGKPIVLSTGLSELYEIDKAVQMIESTGNKKLIILHCIATYPTPDVNVNLNNIDTLKQIYSYPIGFSDHSIGFSMPLAATTKGACIIEKHFTLDKDMFGWDHKVSANPEELKIIVEESKRISKALGTTRIVCPENEERKREFRRSIVTKKTLSAGIIIKEDDLDFKRPGTGISPGELNYVVGRSLKTKKGADEVLIWEDLV
jgi:sialic acid synthase SpsE